MAGSEQNYHKAMNQGHSAAWDQDWTQAARAYQQALVEFPDNPKALNSLALAQFQLAQYNDALKTYMRAARISLEDPVPFEKISQINERLGNIREACQSALYAAELYLKLRDVDKAIENWNEVIQLDPQNLQAYSRLALVHEKTGDSRQSAREYMAVASILQNKGNPQKALEFLQHAAGLDPANDEIRSALRSLHAGLTLAAPKRPKGGTNVLRMAAVKQMPASPAQEEHTPDPVAEARQKALKNFAEVLFAMEDDSQEAVARRDLDAIASTAGTAGQPVLDHVAILKHLGAAIDDQMLEKEPEAIAGLQAAMQAGFDNPAAYFDIGLMLSHTDQQEMALKYIQKSAKHADFAVAARLLSGKILRDMNRLQPAAVVYLEALKIADLSILDPAEADNVLQLYEPMLESIAREKDSRVLIKLCANVDEMLMRENWRTYLRTVRNGMDNQDGQVLPLAEIIVQAQSSQVIEAMKRVNDLAASNHLRSAVDEAFYALTVAPGYLPLHILIADLLIREGRGDEAIAKLGVVANAYSIRGEAGRATSILRRVLTMAPMNTNAYNRLIEQLQARGQIEEALTEYFNLADIYYRLADLDMARKVYVTALHEAQQPSANRAWSVKILQRMADIDMQRLDYKQAIRVFEQLRTLEADDSSVRETLIDLYLRIGEVEPALAEVHSYISRLELQRDGEVLPFMHRLLEAHPEQVMLSREMAIQLYRRGKKSEAVNLLDSLGESLMRTGDKATLKAVVSQIIAMDPSRAEEYRALVEKM